LNRLSNDRGLGLIELTVIIVVIGILAVTAMRSMQGTIDDVKQVKTEREMEMLADAIVGDAQIGNGGARTDFGYVGDVGAFPPNLDALLSNPGGYLTWNGPYIEPGIAEDNVGFKTDEWGVAYNYSGGTIITSTGSGSTISKKIADATSDYLHNSHSATVKDSWDSLPGSIYADSIEIVVSIPDGSGSIVNKTYNPDSTGAFTLDSLPAGRRPLRIIYLPNVDTLLRYLTILPRQKSGADIYNFASAYFGGGGGGGTPASVILRPDGAGANTNLTNSGCVNNYQCVDEVSSDDDGSIVIRASESYAIDTYSLDDPGVSSGTIDSVIVFCRARKTQNQGTYIANLYTYSTHYASAEQNLTDSYAVYSHTWATNPNTSAAWTWTEMNNLQAGLQMKGQNINFPAYCTQVWVEVFYTN